jgi:hypothetical protein
LDANGRPNETVGNESNDEQRDRLFNFEQTNGGAAGRREALVNTELEPGWLCVARPKGTGLVPA